jgi:hypothetical protein
MTLAGYLYSLDEEREREGGGGREREKEVFILVEICLFNTYLQVSVFWGPFI